MHRQLWFWLLLVGAAVGVVLASRGPTEPAPGGSSGPSVTESGSHAEVGRDGDSSNGTTEAASGEAEPLPRWVWGRVVDADGNTVADAQVSLWIDAGPNRSSRVAAVARTDRDGRYELRGRAEPDDRYAAVSVRKPGFQLAEPERVRLRHAAWFDTDSGFFDSDYVVDPSEWDVDGVPIVRDARTIGERPDIVLDPGRRVEGRVTLGSGSREEAPPSFVGAVVLGSRDRLGWPVEADGRFVLWVHPRDHSVGAVLADGRSGSIGIAPLPEREEESAGDQEERELLDASAVADLVVECGREPRSLRVLGEGSPLAGARVWLRPNERSWLSAEVVTRESGTFEVPVGAAVRVAHPQYESAYFKSEEVPSEIRLEPARWLTFRLSPTLTPPVILGRHETMICDRSAGGFRSRPFEGIDPGSEIQLPGFLPEFVTWPEGRGLYDLGVVRLDSGLWVDVRVVDESGTPVPGALVDVEVDALPGVETDDRGRARVGPSSGGVIVLDVEAEGFASAQAVTTLSDRDATLTVTLVRAPTLTLQIVDDRGAPLEGASIIHERWDVLAESDAEGVVEPFEVPTEAPVEIAVTHDGYRALRLNLPPFSAGEERDLGAIALVRLSQLEVWVLNPDGTPAPEVKVECIKLDSIFGDDATTDRDGLAVIAGVEPGRYQLLIKPDEEQGAPCFRPIAIAEGGEPVRIEVTLPESRQHALLVVDSSGQPLEDIQIEVLHARGLVSRWSTTDAEGRAVLEGISDGRWTLLISDDTREQVSVVEALDELPSRVVFDPAATLRVWVRGGDHGFRGEELALLVDGRVVDRASIDQFGFADFRPSPGVAEVRFRCGDRYESPSYRITVPESGSDVELKIELHRKQIVGQELSLRVVDTRGQPVRYADVRADGEWRGSTDALGRATVTWQPHEESLAITVDGDELAVVADPLHEVGSDGELGITVEPSVLVRVRLQRMGEPVSISEEYSLVLRPAEERAVGVDLDLTGVGRWAQCSVIAGDWILDVNWLGHSVGRFPLSVAPGEVIERTIDLPEGVVVSGRLSGARSSRVVQWGSVGSNPFLTSAMSVAEDGTYRGRLPGPGEYMVFIDDADPRWVTIHGPGRYDLDFSREIPGRVTGLGAFHDGLRVLLYAEARIFRTAVAADGRFRLPEVPQGTYRWVLVGHTGWRRHGVVEVDGRGSELEIAVGSTTTARFVAAEPRLWESLEYAESRNGRWIPAGSDPTGNVLLSTEADCWFACDTTHYRFAVIPPMESDGTTRKLTLEPGGMLELSDDLRMLLDLGSVDVEPLSGSFPSAVSMRLHRQVLPAGSYRLRFTGRQPWEATVDIRIGETTTVELADTY